MWRHGQALLRCISLLHFLYCSKHCRSQWSCKCVVCVLTTPHWRFCFVPARRTPLKVVSFLRVQAPGSVRWQRRRP